MSTRDGDSMRVLVVARHPFRLEDLGLDDVPDIEFARLIRRPRTLELAIDEVDPHIVLVDVGYPEGGGIEAISNVRVLAPEAHILALTADPPVHSDVMRAMRAGAGGFVDTGAEPNEFVEAIRTVHAGELWLPPTDTQAVLSAGAGDLDVTAAERRSRLTGIVVGLIPLAGALAGIMSLLFRKYLGHISVRPVDLAIDPTARVVDLFFSTSVLLGILGPLLFVGTWLDLMGEAGADGNGRSWVVRRRNLARILLSAAVLVVTGLLALFADIVLFAIVGPGVAIALLAQVLGLSDELPAAFRIKVRPIRAATGGVIALFLFLTILSTEVLVVGPSFDTKGVQGFIAPPVFGFSARPMEAFDVDGTRPPRDVLYLGGNADLYVLVDPCDEDLIEYVSVGSTRLVVIDEVTCP